MLNIYYGRESVDHEKFIIDSLDPGGRALLIVPDQYTLEAERRLFKETGAEALIDVEVTSMSRLGSRLLGELGGASRTFIDKYGRHMVLSAVAAEHRDELQVFRGLETRNSFLEMLNDFISEMKQYNSGVSEIDAIRSETDPDTYLYRKLSDLSLLYREYEKRISGRYTDSEDYIDLFLSKIGESGLIRGNEIWIYGFDSFAPKATAVIGELMTFAKDVNLVLCCSMERGGRDSDLFRLGRLVASNLLKAAEARHIDCRMTAIPGSYERYGGENAVQRHIESELYALPFRKYAGTEGLPVLVEASNPYNEAENAAAYVLHLIRDKGFRMSDIRIILNDQEVRGPIAKRVFSEYGLELFSDSGRDVADNPIVRYVFALFDTVIERFDTDSVIGMLKTGFAGLGGEEISDLENYAVKYRIRGTMWKKPFTRGALEYDGEALERLNGLRERAVSPCLAFEKLFSSETVGSFIDKLYGFLKTDIDLVSKIEALENAQLESGREDLAEETDQVWDIFLNILRQTAEIMGDEPFDGRSLRELLEVGLRGIMVGMLPPSKDGLIMGTMQRTRIGSTRALVVLGANDGILPSGKPAQGIFGDDEKELFRDLGIELCKADSITLMEEKMGIYRNLSRSGERLYMSYSMSDLDGNALKPSSVWLKLRDIFPHLRVKADAVSSDNIGFLINGEMSGLRHLTTRLERSSERGEIPDEVKAGLNWYKLNDPQKIDAIRNGLSFTNKAEALGRSLAESLFKKDSSREMSLSPSAIEKFSRCPFSYFISYGLRPEERRVFEVAPREIGDICHACLMRLTEKLSCDGIPLADPESPWMKISDGELEELVTVLLNEQLATYRDGVFSFGNEERYRADRIKDILLQAAKNLIGQVRSGSILRGKFEVGFGRGREIPPIEIRLGSEYDFSVVYIEGKIDRVDYLPDSRVKIIDYKTGDEKFTVNEAEKGYRLQLMLYLKAAMEQTGKPAGVFYFRIKEPRVALNGKEWDVLHDGISPAGAEKLKAELASFFRLNGILADDPDVIRSIAGDFSGYSPIVQLNSTKDGIKSSSPTEERLLSDEAFERLTQTVTDTVTEKISELLRGRIDINPMKSGDRSACTFCSYSGICRFNTVFEDNNWNPIA